MANLANHAAIAAEFERLRFERTAIIRQLAAGPDCPVLRALYRGIEVQYLAAREAYDALPAACKS